ncbi:MAG TPA: BlaI/MecI/CopY family transcriptional regulator [Verrucomicrobiae bacterium]|jgi:predicted transcriptional regulator|nr:BlaI/MecI/CopY family transcriptional regulator [Verrucomicrobiae bacterium]
MAKPKVYRLGDLQLKIMKVLWRRPEPTTVAEVHETLSDEGKLAYTTIATMLRKMEARGLVRHRVEERKFFYSAAVQAEEMTRNISAHFLDRLFEGSLADMLAHLLTTQEISREELARLEELIAKQKEKP